MDELNVVGQLGYTMGCVDDSIGVGPLGDVVHLEALLMVFAEDVVGDYVDTEVGDDLCDSLVDERVDVIGSTCHDKDHAPIADITFEDFSFGLNEVLFDGYFGVDGCFDGTFYGSTLDAEGCEVVIATVVDGILVDE